MANVVIESVLAEEAQADLQIRASKEKAARILADAGAEAVRLKEDAQKNAAALLSRCAKEAQEKLAEATARNEEAIRLESEALREAAGEKSHLAAEAILFLLKRGEEE
ncbi:MAG: hypothetical protein J5496_00930 [Lachnospiraceae bacterium]|nr:hypothetical protein [Lachnospiraceae bacterium]